MKPVITLIMAIVVVATSLVAQQNKSNLPNNTPATLGDVRFVNDKITKLEKENADLKKQLGTLQTQPSATSTTSIDEAKIVEVVKKNGFITRRDGDQRWVNMKWKGGVREQMEGRIAATNTRVDTIQTASRLMFDDVNRHSLRLGKLEEISQRHIEQIEEISFDMFKTQLAFLDDQNLVPVTVNGKKTRVKAGEWAQEEIKNSIKKKLRAALDRTKESEGDNSNH